MCDVKSAYLTFYLSFGNKTFLGDVLQWWFSFVRDAKSDYAEALNIPDKCLWSKDLFDLSIPMQGYMQDSSSEQGYFYLLDD